MKALFSRLRRPMWAIPVTLVLLFVLGVVASASAAFAGAPATVPGGVTAAPPAQSSDRAQTGRPTTSSTGAAGAGHKVSPGAPKAPNVVLYDQYNNPAGSDVTSQDFEAAFNQYDDQAADDFVVPAGQTWNVTEVDVDGEYTTNPPGGPAAAFNVYFYSNSATLPGTPVYTATNQTYTGSAGDAVITLTAPAVLAPGTYWVSVQSRQDIGTAGQWFWQNRSVVSNNPSAWRNPGNGFATGCTNWGVKTTCIPSAVGGDQVFRLAGTIGGGATGTSTSTPSGATVTPTATVCASYSVITTTGTIISGTVDIGNHTDDGTTNISLPFAFTFYGTSFSSANVSSNGNLQFTSNSSSLANACLPSTTLNDAILPHWDDLRTDQTGTGCTAYPTGCGVFTATTGTAPNRIFNIEWRTVYYGANTTRANFEARLYETTGQIDLVYGEVAQGGSSATVGIQKDTGSSFTQYECNTAGTLQSGLVVRFTPGTCPTFTPTNTATRTNTPCVGCATNTPTGTPTCVPAGGTPGPWATSTPAPPSRYRGGGASDGTYVYVYGGGNSTGQYLNDLWRWNPANETWTQLANMPTGKQNIQGSYWNGKIYVPGGYIGSHITENSIYDIATNTWSTGAPEPAGRSGMTAAYNNKIYVFGGNPGPLASIIVYDIATNTWSNAAASLPVATTYGRAITVGNFIYIVGGIQTTTTNAVYRYDPNTDTITTMAPLQTARTSAELMTNGTKIFAVAGGDSTFFTGVPLPQSVEIYDIALNTWTYGNPIVQKVAAPSGGLAGGKLMIQGGVDNTTYPTTVQVSTLQGGVPCGSVTVTATRTATTVVNTNTPTRTNTATTVVNTNTPTRTATGVINTNTPTSTNTPGTPGANTNTPTRTAVPATFTPISTNTPCAVPTFSDVHPTDYFYTAVNWLYCEGAITGYADGTFRPYANTTRGQLSKIIVIARHWPIDLTGAPHFSDVPSSNVFYPFIETAYNRNIVSGYADGTFRPFANVTRGQLSKIIVQAMGWAIDTTGGPHFSDVPTTNPFYDFIETAYNHNIISGYSDGTFRWANDATRGQISVIVYRAAAP